MVIGDYFINAYCWLYYCRSLAVILLVAINGYSIGGSFMLYYDY
jgi:hypothetical protein